jgi:hypothetical protein
VACFKILLPPALERLNESKIKPWIRTRYLASLQTRAMHACRRNAVVITLREAYVGRDVRMTSQEGSVTITELVSGFCCEGGSGGTVAVQ